MEATGARRRRRSGDEVRRLFLASARDLFAERGYHGVRTRDVADAAGVGESVLFRHFGSKAGLFEAVVLAPFTEFIDAWASSWDSDSVATADPEVVTRTFVEGFHGFARENRDLVLTLLAARLNHGDPELARVAEEAGARFADGLKVMRDVLVDHSRAHDFRELDHEITVAAAAGIVLSMALFDDWFFAADGAPPTMERRTDEMAALLLRGIGVR